MKTIVCLFFMSGFCGILNAQEKILAAELIGTWTYLGPDKISTNDTIILTRDQSEARSFRQWTFKENKELEMFVRIGNDDNTEAIDVMSEGVTWEFRDPDLLIVKSADNDKYFKLSERSKEKIIFVRSK